MSGFSYEDRRQVIKEIIVDYFKRVDEVDKTDPQRADTLWEMAEGWAGRLELGDQGLRELVAQSIEDPRRADEYRLLYIENPARPGESIMDHIARVLGDEVVEGFNTNMRKFKARRVLGV